MVTRIDLAQPKCAMERLALPVPAWLGRSAPAGLDLRVQSVSEQRRLRAVPAELPFSRADPAPRPSPGDAMMSECESSRSESGSEGKLNVPVVKLKLALYGHPDSSGSREISVTTTFDPRASRL